MDLIRARMDDPGAKGLAAAVGSVVRDGTLPPGTLLPPIRDVAAGLRMSPSTVSAAWATLTRAGMLRTDGRRGTTVRDLRAPATTRYRRAMAGQTGLALDLSTGVPDPALLPRLGPVMAWGETAGTPSSYLEDPLVPELDEVLRRDWPYRPGGLLVVDGAQDALDLVVRTQVGLGDAVAVEHPAFTPLVDLLESVGVAIVPVELDRHGMALESLREALDRGVKAVFLQPRAQNPTGVTMTRPRARRMAHLIGEAGALAVEDDSQGLLARTRPLSLGLWIPDLTVHIRGFSKSHGPDLRLAAMSAPDDVLDRLVGYRTLGQGWSSRLLQRMLVHLLTDPAATAQVRRARGVYAARRAGVVTELAARGVRVGGSDGISIWVPVEDQATALVLLAGEGIAVTPGRAFLLKSGYPPHVRVTAGLVPEADAPRVAAAIARAATTTLWRSGVR